MNFNFLWVLWLPAAVFSVAYCDLQDDIEQAELNPKVLSHTRRRRRYVVFPEGSSLTVSQGNPSRTNIIFGTDFLCPFQVATSLQVAACVSPTALSGAGPIFTNGVAWAMSYDLPNETIHTKDNKYEFPILLKRHKRDLYMRMEKLIGSTGMNGRNCVLRTVCEAAQRLIPRQGILEEILRLIFTYPPEEKGKYGWSASKLYAEAHSAGENKENCYDLFPCPISLLELGLGFGKYPQV